MSRTITPMLSGFISSPLLTEAGEPLLTEAGAPLLDETGTPVQPARTILTSEQN